ncbi:MAG: methyl-accepting chemotaxis protein [Zoogloea sp.]|nr:methyl-accepting chemotaxis protein [Zoogloea sp.]
MNRQARETFAHHRGEMLERLRGQDPTQAQGKSIHNFHRDPGRIRSILRGLASRPGEPHSADITIGEVTFRTHASPILSATEPGKVVAYLACWEDITLQLRHDELERQKEGLASHIGSQIQDIASSMEQLMHSVGNIAERTGETKSRSDSMFASAEQGREVVTSLVGEMHRVAETVRNAGQIVQKLSEQSSRIGVVVGVIKEIADQTNLLALNAAIEAARAGEAGRGFAVVADEVRKLSERTAQATGEIGNTVRSIQTDIRSMVDSMDSGRSSVANGEHEAQAASTALDSILGDIGAVRGLVTEISKATIEQAGATEHVTQQLGRLKQLQ